MTAIDKVQYLQIGVQGENAAMNVELDMTAWAEQYPDATFHILFKPYNEPEVSPQTSTYDSSTHVLTWTVGAGATAIVGVGYTEIRAQDGGNLIKKTRIIPTAVENSVSGVEVNPPAAYADWVANVLNAGAAAVALSHGTEISFSISDDGHLVYSYTDEDEETVTVDLGPVDAYAVAVEAGYSRTRAQFEDELAHMKDYSDIAEAAAEAAEICKNYAKTFVGAPRTAATADDMTDESLIYVFTGTTTASLTNGHWYFYDGEAWSDGGVYNSTALTTDTTLTVSGAAADAKVAGDKLTELKSALTNAEKEANANLSVPVDGHPIIQGTYNSSTGAVSESNSKIRTQGIMRMYKGQTIHFKAGTNTKEIYMGHRTAGSSSSFTSGTWLGDGAEITIGGDWEVIIVFRKSSSSSDTISPSDYDAATTINSVIGEKVNTIEKHIDETTIDTNISSLWVQGGISTSNGSASTSSTRIRTSGWVKFIGTVHVASGYKYMIYAYEGNTYKGVWNGSALEKATNWMTKDVDLYDIGDYGFRFVLATAGDDEIATSAYNKLQIFANTDEKLATRGVPADAKETGDRISDLMLNSVQCSFENGAMNTVSGAVGNGYDYIYGYRRSEKIIRTGSSKARIVFNSADASAIAGISVYEYGYSSGQIVFLRRITDITLADNAFDHTPGTGTEFIRISITVASGYGDYVFHPVTVYSKNVITVENNPNVYTNSENKIIGILYNVSENVLTSGQLLLPPNYSIDGKPVPLHVYFHGTGGMDKWNTNMETLGDIDLSDEFEYWKNEGFAVFDCYPWTTKYYSTSSQISPYMIAPNIRSYVEGIKYVCSHYNVNINEVCVSGLSLGGQMAYWFAMQTEVPVKAIAMMAPSSGWISQKWDDYFLDKSVRARIVEVLGLSDETNADTFINTNNGLRNSTVNQFVIDHLDSFAGLTPAGLATFGVTAKDLFEWSYVRSELVRTLPQWMQDLNLPAIPDGYMTSGAGYSIGLSRIVTHPELSKIALYPIKYWQAFDDVNVSGHVNYTIYNWLRNGGAKVYWRTLANGHGGHGATGYGELAERMDVTTRLGIEMTDVAVAQKEMIDFFYDQIVG